MRHRTDYWTPAEDDYLRSHNPLPARVTIRQFVVQFNADCHATDSNQRTLLAIYARRSILGLNTLRCDVGAERVSRGDVHIKVAQPNVWRIKSHVEWEKAHPGEVVDKSEMVLFLDSDKTNFRADNLLKVSKKLRYIINQMRRKDDSPDAVRLIVQLAQSKTQCASIARKLGMYEVIKKDYKAQYYQRNRDRLKAYYRERYARRKARKEAAHAD